VSKKPDTGEKEVGMFLAKCRQVFSALEEVGRWSESAHESSVMAALGNGQQLMGD
jgi:hypothetical protein